MVNTCLCVVLCITLVVLESSVLVSGAGIVMVSYDDLQLTLPMPTIGSHVKVKRFAMKFDASQNRGSSHGVFWFNNGGHDRCKVIAHVELQNGPARLVEVECGTEKLFVEPRFLDMGSHSNNVIAQSYENSFIVPAHSYQQRSWHSKKPWVDQTSQFGLQNYPRSINDMPVAQVTDYSSDQVSFEIKDNGRVGKDGTLPYLSHAWLAASSEQAKEAAEKSFGVDLTAEAANAIKDIPGLLGDTVTGLWAGVRRAYRGVAGWDSSVRVGRENARIKNFILRYLGTNVATDVANAFKEMVEIIVGVLMEEYMEAAPVAVLQNTLKYYVKKKVVSVAGNIRDYAAKKAIIRVMKAKMTRKAIAWILKRVKRKALKKGISKLMKGIVPKGPLTPVAAIGTMQKISEGSDWIREGGDKKEQVLKTVYAKLNNGGGDCSKATRNDRPTCLDLMVWAIKDDFDDIRNEVIRGFSKPEFVTGTMPTCANPQTKRVSHTLSSISYTGRDIGNDWEFSYCARPYQANRCLGPQYSDSITLNFLKTKTISHRVLHNYRLQCCVHCGRMIHLQTFAKASETDYPLGGKITQTFVDWLSIDLDKGSQMATNKVTLKDGSKSAVLTFNGRTTVH